jgi:intracellular sulfur oxidation DsrE/DsrF family protein
MQTRRTFLTASAATAAASAAFEAAPSAARASAGPYDFAAVARELARPARHRQVMAVNRVADGSVVGYMKHVMEAYEITRGEGPGAMHVAGVFYGRGVVLGLDDAMWKKYRIAEGVRRRGDVLSDTTTAGHPFASEFDALVKRGATFLVCDNALADWATYFVTTAGFNDRSIDDVRADLRRHVFPGAYLVPAGVAALNEAQEARFTYLQASI